MLFYIFKWLLLTFVQKDGRSKVSKSHSVPGRNVVILRSISFSTRSEQDQQDTNDGMFPLRPH
ncbi:hypothetical protein AHAS_Ahas19G0241600 [Arachis hypogaea]